MIAAGPQIKDLFLSIRNRATGSLFMFCVLKRTKPPTLMTLLFQIMCMFLGLALSIECVCVHSLERVCGFIV